MKMIKKNNSKKIVNTTLALILAAAVAFVFTLDSGKDVAYAAPAEEKVAEEVKTEEPIVEETVAAEEQVEEETTTEPQEVVATASTDADAAAVMMNDIEDNSVYENTLRTILNNDYEAGKSDVEIKAFTDGLDERSNEIVARYERAAQERATGSSEYEVGTLLVLADASVSDAEMMKALGDNMGECVSISYIGDKKVATIDMSMEYSVADAVAALEGNELIDVQPNYTYHLTDEEVVAEPTEEVAEEITETEAVEEETTTQQEVVTENNEVVTETTEEAIPADMVEEEVITNQEVVTEEIVEENNDEDKEVEDKEEKTEKKVEGQNDPMLTSGKNAFMKAAGIDAIGAWKALKANGSRVKVGVIDTGVRASHEDLKGIVNTGASVTINGGTITHTISDDHGHGTHVCGIIAAAADNGKGISGVAAGYDGTRRKANNVVELIVVDAMKGNSLSSSDVAKGIDYLMGQGCKVINLSIGGAGSDYLLDTAIKEASKKNVLVVSAAGNEATDRFCSPGDNPNVISVMNAASPSARNANSNYGVDKDVAAPGTSIVSCGHTADNSYVTKTGTSMATPVVSGIAAMIYYTNSGLSPRDVKNIIYTTTRNQGAFNGNAMGFGYVDAKDAVNAANTRKNTSASKVQFNVTNATVYTDDTYAVEYRVWPATISNTKLSWTSSNNGIAKVDANGTITGVKAGTATITGKAQGGVTATVNVTVREKYTPVTKANHTDITGTNTKSAKTTASRSSNVGTYMNGYSYDAKKGETVTITATSHDIELSVKIMNEAGTKLAAAGTVGSKSATVKYTATANQRLFVEVAEIATSKYIQEHARLSIGDMTVKFNGGDNEAAKNIKTTAKAASKDYNSITVSWAKTNGADGYKVYRYNASTKKYALIKTVSYTTLSMVDTGLATGNSYTYLVRPYVNENGTVVLGKESNKVSAKPVLGSTKTTVSRKNFNSLTVKWNKVAGATGYQVYRYNASTKKYQLVKTITSGNTVSFVNTGLATGTKYTYKVRAMRKSGNSTVYGAFSGTAAQTPVLGNAKISKLVRGNGYIKVNWTKVEGASGYTVYRSTSQNGTYKAVGTVKGGNTVMFKNNGTKKGTKYFYMVKAYRTVNGKKVYGESANKANTVAK